ncbi:MAG: RNA polymerase sigma factor [Phenylobacterium sp.]
MSQAHERIFDASEVDGRRNNVEDLYRTHRGWLIAFLRRRFGGLVAEELAQEAFARMLGSNREVRNPRAFLASVAVHAALEAAAPHHRSLEVVHPSSPALQSKADQDEAVLLRQLILKLPKDLREVFLLSRFAGLTNVEIAHRCNLSVKRVEARITKARAMCTALMRD